MNQYIVTGNILTALELMAWLDEHIPNKTLSVTPFENVIGVMFKEELTDNEAMHFKLKFPEQEHHDYQSNL